MAEGGPGQQPLPQDAAAMEADIQATLARMQEANAAGQQRHDEWVDRNLGAPAAGAPGQETWPQQYGQQVAGERSAAELEADLHAHMAGFREQNRVEGARTQEMLDEAGPQNAYDLTYAGERLGGSSVEDAHRAGVRAQDDEHGRRGHPERIPDHDGRFNEYGDRLVASGEHLADFHWGDEVTPMSELDQAPADYQGRRRRAEAGGDDQPETGDGSTSGPKVEGVEYKDGKKDDKKVDDPTPVTAPPAPARGTTYGGESLDDARQQIEDRAAVGRARVRPGGPGGPGGPGDRGGRRRRPEGYDDSIEPVTAPTGAGRGERDPGGPDDPDGLEARLSAEFDADISEIARLKKELEERVGFGKRKKSKELLAAEAGLKAKIDRFTTSPEFADLDIERLELVAAINENIAEERIRIAETEVQGFAAKFGQKVNAVTAWMGRHKKAIGITAAGLLVLTGGGLIAGGVVGAGAAVAAAAKAGAISGAASGGIFGTLRGYFGQRARLAEDNLQGAVEARYTATPLPTEMNLDDVAWHQQSRTYRDTMGRRQLTRTAVSGATGVAGGAVAGGLLAGAGEGYAAAFSELFGGGVEGAGRGVGEGNGNPQLTPEQINEAQKEAIEAWIKANPGEPIPGIEGFNPEAATGEAANGYSDGQYLWNKVQINADPSGPITNVETWQTIIGDGTANGGLEQLKASGFDISMGGDAAMGPDGNITFNGDTWWVENMTTPEDGVYVQMPDGQTFYYDGSLSANEQAALLDQLHDGGQFATPEQIADRLAEQIPDTTEGLKGMQDAVIKDFVDKITSEINSAPDQQAALENHADEIAALPEAARGEIITSLAVATGIAGAVISQMVENAFRRANDNQNVGANA